MERPDLDLRELAELLLGKRLHDWDEILARCQSDLEASREPQQSQGFLARGLLVGACTEAYERHGGRVLLQVLGLVRTFGGADSEEWLRAALDEHMERAAEALVRHLAASTFGGATSTSAEHKRVRNGIAAIKARFSEQCDEELARHARERGAAARTLSDPGELDDRLPLGRAGAFDRDLAEATRTAGRAGEPLALVMIDLDRFKSVNDQHGHPVGDEVLVEVARRVVRRTARKGTAYRYGGEELALLLPDYSVEEAAGLAERIRKDLEAEPISSRRLRVTASFGVAGLESGDGPRELLARADAALYRAKREGRNQVRCEPEPDAGGGG